MKRHQTAFWLAWVFLAHSLPVTAGAGDWHRAGSLRCSDCHTMHNSKGGLPMRYDLEVAPAPSLLRADGATALCLACHAGRGPSSTAPNVAQPSNWEPPGGGFPADLADPLGRAHGLWPFAVVPPQGTEPVVMTCVACHDAHGNEGYRNLRTAPSGRGGAVPAPVVRQAVAATGSNPDQVYLRSNVTYVSGMSQWCVDCHDLITAEHVSGGTALLASHPWDRTIGAGAASGVTDLAAWMGAVTNRVPVQNALGLAPPNDTDQVFCLSCHKAHGSPNEAALIYADGLTMTSTCQQCHNQ
jgi:predicted CXXCH cytochrome family protein